MKSIRRTYRNVLSVVKNNFLTFAAKPIRTFDNFSIRTKLFINAAVLIALLIALATFAGWQVYVIQMTHIPARSAARSMEKSLLDMRFYEQQFIAEAESPNNTEFYLKHSSKSAELWQTSYQQFEEHFNELLRLYGNSIVTEELAPVNDRMKYYRDAFLSLTSIYEQRGFHTFGREGVLHQRADLLASGLNTRPKAYALLLEARLSQEHFFLRKELASAARFNEYVALIEKEELSPQYRTALEEYRRLFQEIVQLDQQIGLNASEGIRGELARTIANVTPVVEKTEDAVLSSTNESVKAVAQSIILAAIPLSIIAILLAITITRFITRRISTLVEASQRITNGDLDHRILVKTTDELGSLAHSFNLMTDKLAAGRKALRNRATDLARNVKKFELISRAVDEAIYEWDIDGDVIRWGDGLTTVFGYAQQNRVSPTEWWTSRIHPEDAQKVDQTLNDHFSHRSSQWKANYRFIKANGQYAYCQDRGFIEYHHGKPVRLVGSVIDVTHRIQLDRAKDEFISVASHQLRTPLGSIRWNLELALEDAKRLPADVHEVMQAAYSSTLRMLALVSDLLSAARIEQGRVQDMPTQSDLVEIIMVAVEEMQPIAREHKVHIDTSSLKDKRAPEYIDPKRFREVVQNLLSNAVKYTPAQGMVTVSVAKKEKDIVISIADTGLGIPEEDYGNMFSKFFRARNVTVTDTEGSGLGLFVVKSYVESWGGRIWFTSRVNKGTTFYVSIPHKLHASKKQQTK